MLNTTRLSDKKLALLYLALISCGVCHDAFDTSAYHSANGFMVSECIFQNSCNVRLLITLWRYYNTIFPFWEKYHSPFLLEAGAKFLSGDVSHLFYFIGFHWLIDILQPIITQFDKRCTQHICLFCRLFYWKGLRRYNDQQRLAKAMIIGKNGQTIKRIGTKARVALEKFSQKKIHLGLLVKTNKNWTTDKKGFAEYGYVFES